MDASQPTMRVFALGKPKYLEETLEAKQREHKKCTTTAKINELFVLYNCCITNVFYVFFFKNVESLKLAPTDSFVKFL